MRARDMVRTAWRRARAHRDGNLVATPTQAITAGLCPGCFGSGQVHRFVPVEGMGPCRTCNGTGLWPEGPESMGMIVK